MSTGTILRKFGRPLIVVVSCTVVSAAIYVVGNKVFQIRTIEVVGNGLNVSVSQQKIPQSLLFFPTEKLKEQIRVDNPLIAHLEIKKKFPHTLLIVAMRRVPMARFLVGNRVMVVDKSGVVVGEAVGDSELPLLRFELPALGIGDRIGDPQVLASLSFIDATQSFLPLDVIAPYDKQSLQAKAQKTDIFIPQQTDILAQTATLQTLWTGFRIKGTLPTKIDLRFDKPVVTF